MLADVLGLVRTALGDMASGATATVPGVRLTMDMQATVGVVSHNPQTIVTVK